MSSCIVNDKTLNRILTFMSGWNFYNNSKLKFAFWKLTEPKEEREKELKAIGLRIKSLNAEAINQRYNEANGKQKFIYSFEECDIYQAYNHLRCLTYQMLEGNIPKKRLYKLLEKIETLMAIEIANEHEKVTSAEWDAI